MPAKSLALRYRRRLWQTLRTRYSPVTTSPVVKPRLVREFAGPELKGAKR
jgi:hypothetical protein